MNSHILSLRTSTWHKDSHSLYDYESSKVTDYNIDFPIAEKSVAVFRKKNSTIFPNLGPSVTATSSPSTIDTDAYDLLTYIQLKATAPGVFKLDFSDSKDFKKKTSKHERVNTDESN